MMKKFFAMLIVLILCVGLAISASASEEETLIHEHALQGGGALLIWTPITKLSEIKTAGNYYLANGFELGYFDRTINVNGAVNLCLNGQSITYSSSVTIESGATVNICDCSSVETGTLGCSVINKGTLNLYSGKIGGQIKNNADAALNIYGGSVEHSGNHAVTNNGTMTVYGGSITATGDYGYAVENNASLLIKGGTFEAIDDVCIDNDSTNAKIEAGMFFTNGSNSVVRNNGSAKMDISGGTFTSKGENTGAVLSAVANSTINVSDGNFIGGGTIISNSGKVTVTGGNFTSTTTATNRYVLWATEAAETNVSGGTFTHKNKEVSLYVYRTTGAAAPISLSGGTFTNGIKLESYRDNGYSTAYPKDILADGYAYYQNNEVVIINASNQYKTTITGGDVTVAAEPEVEICTITFDANGGTVSTTSATTNLQGKLDSLPVPTRANYKFDGWFDAKEGGNSITLDTVYTTSITVYAHWTPETYTITYVLYDDQTDSDTYTYGQDVELPDDVERDGYRFVGWYKDAAYMDGPYGRIINSNASYTFYAKWAREYTVTVAAAEHGSVSANITEAIEGEKVTITIAPDSGYDLADVSVKNSLGNDIVASGSGYHYSFTMPADDVTVSAVFEQAMVRFYANGGSGNMAAVSVTDENGVFTLPGCGFTAPSGMEFKGWALSAEGEVITTETITVTKHTDLFAIWKYIAIHNQTVEWSGLYNVSHTPTLDIGELLPADAQLEAGIDFEAGVGSPILSALSPTVVTGTANASLQFSTRVLTAPASENIVMKLNTSNYGEFTITINVKLYGYQVSFNANGGTGTMADIEVVGEYELPASDFTAPTNKQFKVWSVSGTEYQPRDKLTIAGDTTITALWEDIPVYPLTVESGTCEADEYAEGETVRIVANVAPDGKRFKEWTSTDGVIFENASSVTTTFTMPAKAVTVTANYEDIPQYAITVSASAGGQVSTSAISAVEGDSVNVTATPSNGFMLKSLTVAGEDVTAQVDSDGKYTFTMPASNVEIVVVFEEIPAPVYIVTVTTDSNGTASADPASGTQGTEVSLTATPNAGHQFKEWQVISGGVTVENNKFTIGTENVEIRAIFVAIPQITDPADDTTITVIEGEKATLTIAAQNAAKYQWYIDYNDGAGWKPCGDGTATYVSEPTRLSSNGYRYYCEVTSATGETAKSPIFALVVVAPVALPETGDNSQIGLWAAMLALCGAGMLTLRGRKRRTE